MTGSGNRKLLILCSAITTTLTYIRRLVRGDNVYLYEVTSYRDKETGKVRQRSEYKGKEIIKDNIATVRKPRNRITARKVLDSAPYIMYRFAEDFGIASIMIVMDRGFYSKKNIQDLRKYSLLGAIPATLSLYRDLLSRSRGVENSRNYIPSGNDTIFHMDHSVEGTRYIVFFCPKMRAEKIQVFYTGLSVMEKDLHEMQDQESNSQQDMIRSVTKAAGKLLKYIEIIPSGKTFTYRLKHNAVQARTNRMGYFVLFTNTRMSAVDILRIYRQKDVVEKAFMHSKPCMEPLYARSERGTRARMFLSIFGYSILAMIASKSGMTYQQTEKILSGIKEIVYTNGSHSVVELTKEQRNS